MVLLTLPILLRLRLLQLASMPRIALVTPMVNLTASGSGGTLTWYSNPTLTTQIGTGGTLAPSAAVGTTNYYVTETLNNCQSAPSLVTVTVNSVPSAPVAGVNATYCDGESLSDLSAVAAAGGTLNWYSNAALTTLIGTGATLTPANTIGSSTYYVTETVLGCVSPASLVTVVINPIPVFNLVSSVNPSGCGASDGSITIGGLGASQNATLIVNNGATSTSNNITTNGSGQYLLTGLPEGGYTLTIEINGCQYTLPSNCFFGRSNTSIVYFSC
jgi:hypothetical protein